MITGDLGFGVLTKYSDGLPEQYLNVGVADKYDGCGDWYGPGGYIVFTYSIGTFPTLRCL